MSAPGAWRHFCVVGVGGHARTKLIPAIEANGQAVAGLVSRQARLPGRPTFASIDAALAALPADTVFVLASPPAVHAAQARAVLAAGRDLLVEKPAFVTAAEAAVAIHLAEERGAVIAEAFMQRYTRLYEQWAELWAQRRGDITALDLTFLVPSLPAATFRAGADIASSSLYDIGCYAVALLEDLGLDTSKLALAGLARPGALTEQTTLAGDLDGVRVTARIGVAADYANRVEMRLHGGETVAAWPFFFGRPGERRLERAGETSILVEDDAFRAMLAHPRAAWLEDQPRRFARMLATTATLERLGRQLALARGR